MSEERGGWTHRLAMVNTIATAAGALTSVVALIIALIALLS